MQEFTVAVPQERLDRIRRRVEEFEFPHAPKGAPWHFGTDPAYLARLRDYWLAEYDWREWEGWLNRYPQFRADVDGLDMHFYHIRGKGPNPMPLLLLHGWPGSPVELLDMVEPLSDPAKFGHDPQASFDLVIPSQPGHGFSGKPETAIGPRWSAGKMNALMTRVLGYDRYFAQGGDWGSLTSSWIAYDHPDHCAALHLNSPGLSPGGEIAGMMGAMVASFDTPEELDWAAEVGQRMVAGGGYIAIQSTKPETLGYGMNDSPMGVAGWIMEKLHDWPDLRGREPHEVLGGWGRMLTNIMHYIVTGSFNTAAWFYYGAGAEGISVPPGERVKVPLGFANFPHDFVISPPRSYLEKLYDIHHWTDMDEGGHFGAWEQPEAMVREIRAFFPTMRERL